MLRTSQRNCHFPVPPGLAARSEGLRGRWAVGGQPARDLAGLLRELRVAAGLTQEELAEGAWAAAFPGHARCMPRRRPNGERAQLRDLESKECRHPGRLAAPPSRRLPLGRPVVVECGDDDRDYQPGQFVIHRILDARVAAAQQGPFHRADSTCRDVGGSDRERTRRFGLLARRYVPIRKPSQMHIPLG
jgi:hypothetical protein